jgi:hypothetical protein
MTVALTALALGQIALASLAAAQPTDAIDAAEALARAIDGGRSVLPAAQPIEPPASTEPPAPEAEPATAAAEPPAALEEPPVAVKLAARPDNRRKSLEKLDRDVEAIAHSEPSSEEARQLTNWVVATGDNHGAPFIIIDKVAAMAFAFDGEGLPRGATPVLVGITRGDDSTPGVGERELSQMGPAEKTTPAGRFVARIGPAKGNQKVLWVDFETAVALHAVVTGNAKERRLERLKSPTAEDNRITFGCINVPVDYFKDVVQPLFAETNGVVYILPETRFLIEVFPAFQVQEQPSRLTEVVR